MRRTCISAVILGLLSSVVLAQPSLYERLVERAIPGDEIQQWAKEKVSKFKSRVGAQRAVTLDQTLPPFHRRLPPLPQGETFCQICHPPLPHAKTLRKRSFLNMHTRFIACGTCHLRPEGEKLSYAWLDYGSWQIAPPNTQAFRIGRKVDNEQPIEGWLKIAPFSQGMPAIPKRDSAFAQTVKKTWQEKNETVKIELIAKLHAPLDRKGPKCSACHSETGWLDFVALGADAEQALALKRHVIPRTIDRLQEGERVRILDLLR